MVGTTCQIATRLKSRRGEGAIRIAQGEIFRCADSAQNDLKDSLGMPKSQPIEMTAVESIQGDFEVSLLK
jgi:hypothetical protein